MVVEAASGRMPAYVNTGLNVVHVDDVAAGHLLAYQKGAVGEAYILGGENRTLQWILETVAELTGQRPPRFRLPTGSSHPSLLLGRGDALEAPANQCSLRQCSNVAQAHVLLIEKPAARAWHSTAAVEALRDEIEWFLKHGYVSQKTIKIFCLTEFYKDGVSLNLTLALAFAKS
jgi:dihydroflavonol-4-reductase